MVLFRSYVMVDWSGANSPRTGRDSIWIAIVERGDAGAKCTALVNPPTRAAATRWLSEALLRLADAGRVLAGFDFPFGYPVETARRLGLGGSPWRAMWRLLDDEIRDGDDNASNRVDVAEALNRRISGEAFPFWGNVREEARAYLVRRDRRPHGPGDLAERRLADARVPGASPVWKISGAGSVGSQALLGIPRVWALRNAPGVHHRAAVWPFETGLADDPARRVIFAEIYPSLIVPDDLPGKPKDAGQVTALARHFAEADQAGALAAWLAGDPALIADERRSVEREEGWILGVTGPVPRPTGASGPRGAGIATPAIRTAPAIRSGRRR